MFAVIARFKFQPGCVDEAIALLQQAAGPSRDEPGCHIYIANRDLEDPDTIVMYEVYDDGAAFEAHRNTPHFQEIVAAKVVPLLADRRRETFEVVTPL